MYTWSSNSNAWKQQWELSSLDPIKCRIGNPCGPFGICSLNASDVDGISCSCPTGFHANSSQDRSLGCSRNIPLPACGAYSDKYNITMTEDVNKDYYYNDIKYIQDLNDIEECKKLCLGNCTCLAAAYSSTGACFLKGNSTTKYLVNGISTSNSPTLMMKVAVSTANIKGDTKRVVSMVVTVVAVVSFIGILIVISLLCRRRYKNGHNIVRLSNIDNRPSDVVTGVGPVCFRYHEMVKATEDFSHPLNEGGNGMVYKGWVNRNKGLPGSKTVVAVKLLKASMAAEGSDKVNQLNQEEQFRVQIRKLGKIHHTNLVGLLGYCVVQIGREVKRLLVYEYMQNGSLDKYLHLENTEKLLPWTTRYAIAVGIARGIAYLHNDCNPPILHCDINIRNVLLDGNFVPKVAGFGFARMFQPQKDHVTMTAVIGTRGYIAPEWLKTDEITSKVDVYSFGMVLLELIHGHFTKSYDRHHAKLTAWASQCISTHTILPSIENSLPQEFQLDPDTVETTYGFRVSSDIQEDPDSEQKLSLLRLAAWCLHPSSVHRPTISQVLQTIEGDHSQIADMENPPNATIASITMISDNGGMSYTPSFSVLSAR